MFLCVYVNVYVHTQRLKVDQGDNDYNDNVKNDSLLSYLINGSLKVKYQDWFMFMRFAKTHNTVESSFLFFFITLANGTF